VTLREALVAARDRLVAAGVAPQDAAIDVDLYARTILGWDRARLLTEQQSGRASRSRATLLGMDLPSRTS
jgi:hypothetical protein